jgi:hypothetical protein
MTSLNTSRDLSPIHHQLQLLHKIIVQMYESIVYWPPNGNSSLVTIFPPTLLNLVGNFLKVAQVGIFITFGYLR